MLSRSVEIVDAHKSSRMSYGHWRAFEDQSLPPKVYNSVASTRFGKGLESDLGMVRFCKGPLLEEMSHCVPDWDTTPGDFSDSMLAMMDGPVSKAGSVSAGVKYQGGDCQTYSMDEHDFVENTSWAEHGARPGKVTQLKVVEMQQSVHWGEGDRGDGDGVAPTKSSVTRDSGGLECVLNQTAHSTDRMGGGKEGHEAVRDDELEQWLQYPGDDGGLEAECAKSMFGTVPAHSVQMLKDTFAPGVTTTRLVRSSPFGPNPRAAGKATKPVVAVPASYASADQHSHMPPVVHPYFQSSSRAQTSAAALEMAAQRAAGMLPQAKASPFGQVRTLSGALAAQSGRSNQTQPSQGLRDSPDRGFDEGTRAESSQGAGTSTSGLGSSQGQGGGSSGRPGAVNNFTNFRPPSLCVFDRSRGQAATSSGTGARVRTHSSQDHGGVDPNAACLLPAALSAGGAPLAPGSQALNSLSAAATRPDPFQAFNQGNVAAADPLQNRSVADSLLHSSKAAAAGGSMLPPRPVAPWARFGTGRFVQSSGPMGSHPAPVQAKGNFAPLSSATSSLRVPESKPARQSPSQGGSEEGRQSVLTGPVKGSSKAGTAEPTVTSNSAESGQNSGGASRDLSQSAVTCGVQVGQKRGRTVAEMSCDGGDTETLDTRETEDNDDDTATEATDRKENGKVVAKSEGGGRKGAGGTAKRSRAAEVHNMSERRRRDRINEKMRALQELIPNSNKTDKASMLDEAIEYLKMLQLQLQVMSMRSGIGIPQLPSMGMGQVPVMPGMGGSLGHHGGTSHLGMMNSSGDMLGGSMGMLDLPGHDRMGGMAGVAGHGSLHGMGMMDPSMRMYQQVQAQQQQQLHRQQQHQSQQLPLGAPGGSGGAGLSLDMFNAYLMQSQGGASSGRGLQQ